MRFILIRVMITAFILFAANLIMAAQTSQLIYTPIPLENKGKTVAAHKAMVDYISSKLGRQIRISYEEKHQDIINKFVNGEIQIATLGPVPYVFLHEKYKFSKSLVLVNENSGLPKYTCSLITSFDGPKSINELKSPIALTQPLSSCGYFAMSFLLRKNGKNIDSLGYQYIGSHEETLSSVLRGQYKAGGIKTEVAKKYEGLTIKILEETKPLPAFSVVINETFFTEKEIELIEKALLEVPSNIRENWGYGKYGFVKSSDSDFDHIREMMSKNLHNKIDHEKFK